MNSHTQLKSLLPAGNKLFSQQLVWVSVAHCSQAVWKRPGGFSQRVDGEELEAAAAAAAVTCLCAAGSSGGCPLTSVKWDHLSSPAHNKASLSTLLTLIPSRLSILWGSGLKDGPSRCSQKRKGVSAAFPPNTVSEIKMPAIVHPQVPIVLKEIWEKSYKSLTHVVVYFHV